MRLARISLLCAVAWVLGSGVLWAENGQTRPPKPKTPSGPTGPERPFRGNSGAEETIDSPAVREFFKANSPNRWAAFDSLPADQQQRVGGRWMFRYGMVQWMKREKQDVLLKIKMDQMRIEDDIFKLHQDICSADGKAGGLANAEEAKKLRAELLVKVRTLVETRMLDRDERIKSLSVNLESEIKRLERDRKDIDKLVAAEYEAQLADGHGRLAPIGPRRGPEKGGDEKNKK